MAKKGLSEEMENRENGFLLSLLESQNPAQFLLEVTPFLIPWSQESVLEFTSHCHVPSLFAVPFIQQFQLFMKPTPFNIFIFSFDHHILPTFMEFP